MDVLVSCKTTNLDVYGESVRKKVAQGLLSSDHLKRLQEDHDFHQKSRTALLESLVRHNISYKEISRGLFWPDLKNYSAVITVGGDGTVLEASHHILEQNIPLMGVRSSPMSVGYLCCCDYDGIEQLVDQIASNKISTIEVNRLRAVLRFTQTGGEIVTDPILNDFLYANANPAATTRYQLTVGERSEVHRSSGIWLATAAGSTAAIHAAGGNLVGLEEQKFQYLVRELYQAPGGVRCILEKGFWDFEHRSFSIENRCDDAILALDGQHGLIRLGFGDTICFEKAPPLRLLRSL